MLDEVSNNCIVGFHKSTVPCADRTARKDPTRLRETTFSRPGSVETNELSPNPATRRYPNPWDGPFARTVFDIVPSQ